MNMKKISKYLQILYFRKCICIYRTKMFDNQNISKYVRRILEVKLPTIWTAGKAEVGIVRAEKKRCEKTREEEK